MPTANLPANLTNFLGQYGLQSGNLSSFYLAGLGQQLGSKDEELATLQDYGNGQRASINQDYSTQQNNLMAQLASQGLSSTSLQLSGGLGVERNRQLSLGNLNDQLLSQKLGILSQNNGSLQALLGSAAQADYQKQALAQQMKLAQMQNNTNINQFNSSPQQQALGFGISGAQQSFTPTQGGGANGNYSGFNGVLGNLQALKL